VATSVYTRTLFAEALVSGTRVAEPDPGEVWVVRNVHVYLRESVLGPNVLLAGPHGNYFAKLAPTNLESIAGDESVSWEGRIVLVGAEADALTIEVSHTADVAVSGYVFQE